MVIEAAQVTKDGELIGYVGTQFILIDQYDEKAATAQVALGELTQQ